MKNGGGHVVEPSSSGWGLGFRVRHAQERPPQPGGEPPPQPPTQQQPLRGGSGGPRRPARRDRSTSSRRGVPPQPQQPPELRRHRQVGRSPAVTETGVVAPEPWRKRRSTVSQQRMLVCHIHAFLQSDEWAERHRQQRARTWTAGGCALELWPRRCTDSLLTWPA